MNADRDIEPGSPESCIKLPPLAQAIHDMPFEDFMWLLAKLANRPTDPQPPTADE